MNRRQLKIGFILVSVFGLAALTGMVISSMSPSHVTKQKAQTLRMLPDPKLENGEYIYLQLAIEPNKKFLYLKNDAGKEKVFAFYSYKNKLFLPEIKYWRIMFTCENLSLNKQRGLLNEADFLHCKDSLLSDFKETHWDFMGKNLGCMSDNLVEHKIKKVNDEILISKENNIEKLEKNVHVNRCVN